jgi:hypothetical protein
VALDGRVRRRDGEEEEKNGGNFELEAAGHGRVVGSAAQCSQNHSSQVKPDSFLSGLFVLLGIN